MNADLLIQSIKPNETAALLQLANRTVLDTRMAKAAIIKEAIRRSLLN